MKPHRFLLVGVAALVLIAAASGAQAGRAVAITGCGQVVTSDAFLTHDLICPGGIAIIVRAAGVTIDLKGFTIRGGNAFFEHFGIYDDHFDRLTVKNGVVRNFRRGIFAFADEVSVSNVVTSANSEGITIGGDSASVTSSTASANGSGIFIGGDSASVTSSTASGNTFGLSGIAVQGNAASIKSSSASANGAGGIYVSGDAASIKGNQADANGFASGISDDSGAGIVVQDYTKPPVGKNTARGNDDPAECIPASLC